MKSKTIKVDYLARVEGEGGLLVRVRNEKVEDVRLNIFEPPRFFEAFLRGRAFTEAPDITARICGICPVAYQMSAAHAMEQACGVAVGGQLRNLRRLLYCGEWIESHALHVYLLHAPDFLGYESGIAMAKDFPQVVKDGLALKKTGNDLVALLGGREIHPINVKVGGFYSVPSKEELTPIKERLEKALEISYEAIRWTAGFEFPDLEQEFEYVALRHPEEYPLNEGRVVSTNGLDIDYGEYLDVFEEEQVKHSTSLHSRIRERGLYLVGPQARYNLNFDRLPARVQEAALASGLTERCTNPFKSIVVRAVELAFACDEALRLIDAYEPPEERSVEVTPRAGTGNWATEAPRGLLFHQYSIDDKGIITSANIVPPTSQNQKAIEADLGEFVQHHLDLPHDKLTWQCEQVVRNYDPCISCSCHFLRLHIDR